MRPVDLFHALEGVDGHVRIDEGSVRSIAELAGPARGVAVALRDHGGPGSRVATMIADPSHRAPALLAIAAADMTVVPLGFRWPPKRSRRVLEISKASLLLTDDSTAALAHCHDRARIVAVAQGLCLLRVSETAPPFPQPPALYVLFTSGTTGAPKGVRMRVDAAYHHFRVVQDWLELTRDDVVMQFADLCFDTSQEEVWPTLLTGASLSSTSTAIPGFAALARDIRQSNTSVLELPTAYWRSWAQAIQSRQLDLPSLRTVVIGGEAAFWRDARAWRSGPLGHVQLINSYGPTEAGITATAFEVPEQILSGDGPLPIGRALSGRDISIGTDSELIIDGPCLYAGYEGENVAAPRGRGYRTGDLVRRDAESNNLVFLGRVDREVKVRGSRVNLDAVEAELMALYEIAEVKALCLRSSPGDTVLAACVVAHPDETAPTASQLRTRLSGNLLDAMIPSVVVAASVLPTTTSGKVDSAACAVLIAQKFPTLTP